MRINHRYKSKIKRKTKMQVSMEPKTKVKALKAKQILLEAQVAIDTLESLGPDYAIWQNAQITYKTLKQIKNKLRGLG